MYLHTQMPSLPPCRATVLMQIHNRGSLFRDTHPSLLGVSQGGLQLTLAYAQAEMRSRCYCRNSCDGRGSRRTVFATRASI